MKKLYRDPRNSILGGVASGIAKYFNKDLPLLDYYSVFQF